MPAPKTASAVQSRVLVVRSGSTDWDAADRLQGATDMPVSPGGLEHLRRCVDLLAAADDGPSLRLGSIWCGPDEASTTSAELLSQTTGGTVHIDDDLAEMNLGLWEGMLVSDMVARFPKACKAWMDDPSLVNPPGGESVLDALDRLTGAAARVLDRSRPGAAVCFVLRPIASGMVRCWLAGEPTCNIWCEARKSNWSRWFSVNPRTLARAAVGS